MNDDFTNAVLDYQNGRIPLDTIRNRVLIEVYAHLRRYRRKSEDEVSEFLLEFHDKIENLLKRYVAREVPFRHFLLRKIGRAHV